MTVECMRFACSEKWKFRETDSTAKNMLRGQTITIDDDLECYRQFKSARIHGETCPSQVSQNARTITKVISYYFPKRTGIFFSTMSKVLQSRSLQVLNTL